MRLVRQTGEGNWEDKAQALGGVRSAASVAVHYAVLRQRMALERAGGLSGARSGVVSATCRLPSPTRFLMPHGQSKNTNNS